MQRERQRCWQAKEDHGRPAILDGAEALFIDMARHIMIEKNDVTGRNILEHIGAFKSISALT